QAEDGIRDRNVTGVQTCALPILQSHVWIAGGEGWVRVLVVVQHLGAERIAAQGEMRVIGGGKVGLALDVLRVRAGDAVERRLLLMSGGGQGGRRESAKDGHDDDGQKSDRYRGFDQAEAALSPHFNAPTRPYMAEINDTAMKPTMMPTATVITGSITDVIARIRYSSSSS